MIKRRSKADKLVSNCYSDAQSSRSPHILTRASAGAFRTSPLLLRTIDNPHPQTDHAMLPGTRMKDKSVKPFSLPANGSVSAALVVLSKTWIDNEISRRGSSISVSPRAVVKTTSDCYSVISEAGTALSTSPDWRRMALSISRHRAGCSRSTCFAFSRPCANWFPLYT